MDFYLLTKLKNLYNYKNKYLLEAKNMGKETNVLKSLEESSVSRRSFLKGTAALGAMAAMYGCSKDSGSEVIYGGGGIPILLVLKLL